MNDKNRAVKTLEELIKQLVPDNPEPDYDDPVLRIDGLYKCADCGAYEAPSAGWLCAPCTQANSRGYKVGYKGGRCWNGAHRDAGRVTHSLPLTAGDTSFDTAVCGTKPGERSYGWVIAGRGQGVTCKRCLAKMDEGETK